MRTYVICCLMILIIFPAVAVAGEWRLAMCYGESATADDLKYREAIGNAAERFFSTIDSEAEIKIQIRQCVEEPDIACYADTSAIYCREEYFSHLVRTAAWIAAERAFILVSEAGEPSALNQHPSLDWTDAYLLAEADRFTDGERLNQVMKKIYAKGQLTEGDLNSLYGLYLDIHTYVNNEIEADPDNIHLAVAIQLYQASLDYAFAFLLGHEAFHFNDNRCQIGTESIVKTHGTWPVIRSLQQREGLYDPSKRLELSELNADHCGLKWLQVVSEQRSTDGDAVFNALTRRMAIELLASPVLIGLKGNVVEDQNGVLVPAVKVVPGYLHPQSRLTLIASTLRLTEETFPEVVKMCGAVAKAMVSIIQDAVTHYPQSSGIVPDELLAELPPGVERSWNGEPWSEASYACITGD